MRQRPQRRRTLTQALDQGQPLQRPVQAVPFPAARLLAQVGVAKSTISPPGLWKQGWGWPGCSFVLSQLTQSQRGWRVHVPRSFCAFKGPGEHRSSAQSSHPPPNFSKAPVLCSKALWKIVCAPEGCMQDRSVPSGTFLFTRRLHLQLGNMQQDMVCIYVLFAAPEVELYRDGRTALSLGVLM